MKAPSTFPSRTPKARKGPGRPPGKFTQHHRIDRLRELLESEPRGLTLDALASTLRITQRSVRRYLEALQGTTELESIATAPGAAHVWRIKPSERGRAVPLRRAQAYAILAGRQSLEVLRGSALYDELDIALGQIEKLAQTPFRGAGKGEISGDNQLEARFLVLPHPPRSYNARGEDLDELFRAVADLRVLRYRPRTRAGEPRADRVDFLPYAMLVHRGALVLVGARREAPDQVEVVSLEGMVEVRASETERFTLPKGFDVNDYVQGELGVARPVRETAIVEFEARVAEEVRTRKVHPRQRWAPGPEGRIRVQVPLVSVPAIVAWVLGFGDAARVVEPPELAREVGEILTRAAARYSVG